jgi:TRAP-type uncharacterized transport system fused permease subunit
MLVFAAATQGYFLVRTRWYETIALLLVTFTLFGPASGGTRSTRPSRRRRRRS